MADPYDSQNSKEWKVWQNYVLNTLVEQNNDIKKVEEVLNGLKTDFEVHRAEMRMKAGVWGLIAGAIPVTIGLIVAAIGKLL